MSKLLSDVIKELASGELDARASTLMAELAQAVEETGGDAKLTLLLTIKKQNRMAVIRPSIKVSKPQPAVDDTMFFVTPDGELTRDDPKQLRLPRVEKQPARVVALDGGKKTEDSNDKDED